MQVDIYDFDKTVVPFDSALKYWGFCMVHNPWDHTVAAVSIYLGHDDADAYHIRSHVQEGGVFVYPPYQQRKEREKVLG